MSLRDRLTALWYRYWACPRGRHHMKFSGCMYCGAMDGRIRFHV